MGDFIPGLNGEMVSVMRAEDLILSRIDRQGVVVASRVYDQPGGGRETPIQTFVDAQGSIYVFYQAGPLFYPVFFATKDVRLAKFSSALVPQWDKRIGECLDIRVAAAPDGFFVAQTRDEKTIIRRLTFEAVPVWTRVLDQASNYINARAIDAASPRLVVAGRSAAQNAVVVAMDKATGAEVARYNGPSGDDSSFYVGISTQPNGSMYLIGRTSSYPLSTLRTTISPSGQMAHFLDEGFTYQLIRSRVNPQEVFTIRDLRGLQVERRNAATDALLGSYTVTDARSPTSVALSRDGTKLGIAYSSLDLKSKFALTMGQNGTVVDSVYEGNVDKVTYSGSASSLVANDGGALKHLSSTNPFLASADQAAPLGHEPVSVTADAQGGKYVVSDVGENKVGGKYALTKFSATGQTLWSRLIFQGDAYPLSRVQASTTDDGTTTIAAGDGLRTILLRFTVNGALAWQRVLDDYEFGAMDVGADGSIYLAKRSGEIRKLGANGNQVWSRVNAAWEEFQKIRVMGNGDIAMLVGPLSLRIIGLSPMGTGKWSHYFPSEINDGIIGWAAIKLESPNTILVGAQETYLPGRAGTVTLKVWRIQDGALKFSTYAYSYSSISPDFAGLPNGNVAVITQTSYAALPKLRMFSSSAVEQWSREIETEPNFTSRMGLLADSQNNVYATFQEQQGRDIGLALVKLNGGGDQLDRKSIIGEHALFGISPQDKIWVAFGQDVFLKGRMLTLNQYRQNP